MTLNVLSIIVTLGSHHLGYSFPDTGSGREMFENKSGGFPMNQHLETSFQVQCQMTKEGLYIELSKISAVI